MINKLYLTGKIIMEMKKFFSDNGFLVLNDFFEKSAYSQMKKELSLTEGVTKKVPDKYSYEELSAGIDETTKNFVAEIVGKSKKFKVDAKRFRHRDYTLIHDEMNQQGCEFFIFICDTWKNDWGGMRVYADSSGKQDSLIFPPNGNCFCIVDKKKGWNSFFKYVNNRAGKRSFVVLEGSSV